MLDKTMTSCSSQRNHSLILHRNNSLKESQSTTPHPPLASLMNSKTQYRQGGGAGQGGSGEGTEGGAKWLREVGSNLPTRWLHGGATLGRSQGEGETFLE